MGRTGVTKSCSRVPRSFSRTIEKAVKKVAVGVVGRDLDGQACCTCKDGVIEVAIILDVTDDMKGVGILQAIEQLAALAAAIGVEYDGVDLPDVGVNAETKHHHLQQRNDKREK